MVNTLGPLIFQCEEAVDLFSVESLAAALHVRKSEVVFWIEQNWLEATIVTRGKRRFYSITPEGLKELYMHHHRELLVSVVCGAH